MEKKNPHSPHSPELTTNSKVPSRDGMGWEFFSYPNQRTNS
jgi:hypothetical protein